ncbi:hypothetical protein AK812_SmicGene44851 [Symbiodinium microadriaticum]|uniref:Reticulocyte-binding protein 2-like a n=1 Tax=Symbiodinium microadriaticum TaxID=2951 RepID=A0A1Q9BXH1_SYMMI|nr:hypothetical protein AK812_SmicGene44851 [Symbiodinium microadriaticum]
MEEIGASLEKAVKERKPGTWQEEKSGFNEFKQRLRNLKDDKTVAMSDLSTEGKDKGIAENILEYEERIEQYEKSTGEKVQENLKVDGLAEVVSKEKALEKAKVKVKAKARTSEKDLVTKAKEKVTKAKVEEETGKAEVEVSEVTKVEVEDSKAEAKDLAVSVATKVKEKEKHKQLLEFVITVTSTDTLKHSAERSSVTWDIKLGKYIYRAVLIKDIPVDPANLKPTRKTYGEEPINRDFFENDQQWIDDENEEFGEAFDGLGWTGEVFQLLQWSHHHSETVRYPPFSVGMVYEHNDEELPEPDLEPGEIWEDSEYGSDQEQDLFGDEDSGPPNLSDEEIRDLDRKAMVTEIDRLIAMQAVQRNSILVVHVDDIQAAGKSKHLEPVLNKIGMDLLTSVLKQKLKKINILRSCALGQDVMCADMSADELGIGTFCGTWCQELCTHPQMLSAVKDLGQFVQEQLCASHSLEEETEAGEDQEQKAAMSAVVAKELKDLMEKNGLNVRMLAEQISELKGTMLQMTAEVVNLKEEIEELKEKWNTFIEEEESARNEYAKYFEEQERLKQELRADRDRLLEKEHRMEGHLGPSRKEYEEWSDRPYFDMMNQEHEAQEAMEENENEYYTQSFEYISEEEAGPQWQEEGEAGTEDQEPEKKQGETQEEYDAKRKELLAKARADIAAKKAKSEEQERGLKTPVDKSHEWKFYTDNKGNVWKQNYKTGEKIWWNFDYKYKHEKGKGKDAYEKAGKGHRPREPFKPRDEEDAKYWERMGQMEEEKRKKREEEKAAKEEKERKEKEAKERIEKAAAEAAAAEEERQKQKARETLEKAAEENERREAEAAAAEEEKKKKAAAEEEKKKKAAAAEEEKKRKAAAAAEERKKMEEAEAEKRKEQKEKKRIEELEKELAELRRETRSETGSTKGETRSETGSTKGEGGKTERQEQASSSDEDPELKGMGPPSPDKFMRGTPKHGFEEHKDRNLYAVFPFDGNDYQWKWNQDTHFWYYFDLQERQWHRQDGKDAKGAQVCMTQESRWKQMKGKMKGKGRGKNKGEEEDKKQKEEEAAAPTSSEKYQQQPESKVRNWMEYPSAFTGTVYSSNLGEVASLLTSHGFRSGRKTSKRFYEKLFGEAVMFVVAPAVPERESYA